MDMLRAAARLLAGLLVVGAVAVGGLAPAQAQDTGWNGTVSPVDQPTRQPGNGLSVSTHLYTFDTGWNGT